MRPYDLGYDAFLCGKTKTSNPYSITSIEYEYWLDGYYDAKEDEHEANFMEKPLPV